MTPLKRIGFIFATLVLIIVLTFILGEVGINLYYFTNPRHRTLLIPDPYLGQMRPKSDHFIYVYDEGDHKIRIPHRSNAMGFLGEEIRIDKPKDTYRILIMGDSYTEAIQMPDGQNFVRYLQDELNQNPDFKSKKIEVINAGVAGYSPLRDYLLYKRKLAKLKSDLVIVQLFANDVYEDNRFTATSIMDDNNLPIKIQHFFIDPKYSKERDIGIQYQEDSLFNRIREFILSHSRLVEYFYGRHYRILKKTKYNRDHEKDEYFIGNQFLALYNQHGPLEREDFRNRVFGLTEHYLLAIRDLVAKSNAQLMMFYIPMEGQLKKDSYSQHVRVYTGTQFGHAWNDRLAQFSEKNQIPFLDLTPTFQMHEKENLYLNQDGHLTLIGHRLTAETLAAFIEKNHFSLSRGQKVDSISLH